MRGADRMNFNCPKHGEVDHVLVNGYGFGDRLLEGIMFEVRVSDAHEYDVRPICPDDLKGLDAPHWSQRCREYAATSDFARCPHERCNEDVSLQPWDEDWVELAEYRKLKGWCV